MAQHSDIVLFHYPFSPLARKVIWYLTLRGIEYEQCIQPAYLPREDINALGVKYRRIPIMSIGRDIYCDTRLIIDKLEERFPSGALGASQPDQKAVEKLLESWTIDGGIFVRAVQVLPPDLPLLNDPKFRSDREEYSGRSWDKKAIEAMRPEGLTHIRDAFFFLETGLLADGRQWIMKTEKPSLADIEAVWPFHWVLEVKGALPPSLFSKETFPKVYAWVDRFSKAVSTAGSSAPKPTTWEGAEAVKYITQAEFSEPERDVDASDPLGLQKGQDVESWPIDTGFKHHDQGKLVSLNSREAVLASRSKIGGREVRIHHPRWNYRIRAVGAGGPNL